MSKKQLIATDGNSAAAKMAYKLSDMAVIYPITPSSPMAETIDELQAKGEKNIFGNVVKTTQMQSEAGVAGALHGALSAGNLATTFTSSQGLLLMLPNMYKIAGENLPCVIHVAARTIATHALSIFGDHSDVMAARGTGFALLCASSVQEAQDFALAAHIATLEARVPILHFFDGFRTSHEINTIEAISDQTIAQLVDHPSVWAFRASGLTPDAPVQRGTAQNPDVFFQNREASTPLYNNFPKILQQTFAKIGKATGRNYHLFDYVGAKDATDIIVSMGSSNETIEETISTLALQGKKVGLVKVRLFRPFSVESFARALPKTTQRITVLDRTKESGAIGDPLYTEICTALLQANIHAQVFAGRYGLSSKDFNPQMVLAIFNNMQSKKPKNQFTIGINDDVCHSSLLFNKKINTLPKGTTECKFYGLGSDGTVSANKNSVKIIAGHTPYYAQAYFEYDSKKAGSITVSHLRFGKHKIQATYLAQNADFVACHNPTYLKKFDVLESLKPNGIFLLNAPWSRQELEKEFPVKFKQTLAQKHAKLFVIDADKIASGVGMPGKINLIMQTAFFKLVGLLPEKESIKLIKDFAKTTYAKKGTNVVEMNMKAIDLSLSALEQVEVPNEWKNASSGSNTKSPVECSFVEEIVLPISQRKGDTIPVSAFSTNGEVPLGTSAVEKRNIAKNLPQWIKENCIQCNQCALVCPHACIRPYLLSKNSTLSKKLGAVPSKLEKDYDFLLQLSPKDCTGCGNCAHVCPALQKALKMVDASTICEKENKRYDLVKNHQNPSLKSNTIVSTQFKKPLFEFSGACAGCGETAYIKLLTQLFGERLVVANATGCSSIFGGSYPTCPYTTNKHGKGPAWSNSLFEDNAEFSYGMYLAHKHAQSQIEVLATSRVFAKPLQKLLDAWMAGDHSDELQQQIVAKAEKDANIQKASELISLSSALTDKTFWAIGGDGWAYDIGFGGIDHVLSSGEKVRILVLDTEVYSNTGGQCSKATPMGSVAKFATNGKRAPKKDMFSICTQYPNVYVANVSLGANMTQCQKAFEEAEANDGPSIIFAYAPCQNQGINMSKTPEIQKQAVKSGHVILARYNQKMGLVVDPPFATESYDDFIGTENRFKQLKTNCQNSKEILTQAKKNIKTKIEKYKNKADQN